MPFAPHEIEWTPEKSNRLWDYYGSNPKYPETFFGYIAGNFVAKRLIEETDLASNARLLDFSCGRGDIIAASLPRLKGDQEFYATDFSDTYVREVAERFRNEPRFKGATLTQSMPSPYADNFFVVVIATEVIEHLLDCELEAMLTECHRLLTGRPGVSHDA